MDGLAATVAIFAISLSILSYTTNQFRLTDICIILFGSILGFSYFNYPTANYTWEILEVCLLDTVLDLLVFYLHGIVKLTVLEFTSSSSDIIFSIPLIDFVTVVFLD